MCVKSILVTLALMASGSAFADSVTTSLFVQKARATIANYQAQVDEALDAAGIDNSSDLVANFGTLTRGGGANDSTEIYVIPLYSCSLGGEQRCEPTACIKIVESNLRGEGAVVTAARTCGEL